MGLYVDRIMTVLLVKVKYNGIHPFLYFVAYLASFKLIFVFIFFNLIFFL